MQSLLDGLSVFLNLDEPEGPRRDTHRGLSFVEAGGAGTDIGTRAVKFGQSMDCVTTGTATGQGVQRADEAAVRTGDIDFYLSFFINADLFRANAGFSGKWAASGTNREWLLYRPSTSLVFGVLSGSFYTVTASNFGALASGADYFFEAWHDSVNNQIGVAVNLVENTAAHTAGVNTSTQALAAGFANGIGVHDGPIAKFGFWKRIPTSTERRWLYNGGYGRRYQDFATQRYFISTAAGSAPTAPSGLTATTASSSQIDCAWTDNSDDEDNFELDYDTSAAFDSPATTVEPAADATSYNVTGLSPSTLYYFRLRAVNSFGNSAYTATASDTTDASSGSLLSLFAPGMTGGLQTMSGGFG